MRSIICWPVVWLMHNINTIVIRYVESFLHAVTCRVSVSSVGLLCTGVTIYWYLHFTWGVADAKCIVIIGVCLSVGLSLQQCIPVLLVLCVFPCNFGYWLAYPLAVYQESQGTVGKWNWCMGCQGYWSGQGKLKKIGDLIVVAKSGKMQNYVESQGTVGKWNFFTFGTVVNK